MPYWFPRKKKKREEKKSQRLFFELSFYDRSIGYVKGSWIGREGTRVMLFQ
jgi:hypothetical protein